MVVDADNVTTLFAGRLSRSPEMTFEILEGADDTPFDLKDGPGPGPGNTNALTLTLTLTVDDDC
jgi:hypothetical protein